MALRISNTVPKNDPGNNQPVLIEGFCHSSDTKPVEGIAGGSNLIEYDTGGWYFFNEETQAWSMMRMLKE